MRTLAFFLCAVSAFAEVHTLTLQQALARALEQNPEVVLARLDAVRVQSQTEQMRDPYSLKLGVGSGAAYTYGFPSSIDGNAPSIFQARAQRTILDRSLTYRIAQSREAESGAGIDVNLRRQEIAYRVSNAFLDAEYAARSAQAADLQYRSLLQVKQFTDVRVSAGRELPVESNRANYSALLAENAAEEFRYAGSNVETTLAQLLGYPAGDRVRPALEERTLDTSLVTQDQALLNAMANSLELRRLESNVRAKQLEVKSYEASWMPRINLISQYSLLARYNNFDVFYPRFQRNNAQIGASIELPILTGKAPKAGKAMAETDIDKLRIEIDRTKRRIAADLDQSYRDVERVEKTRTLRRAALDLAREDLSVALAQYDEGRATMAQVEALRAKEQEEWIKYYDAQRMVEIARLNVRRASGTVLASVR